MPWLLPSSGLGPCGGCVGSPLFSVEARALACLFASAGRLAGSVVKLLCGPLPGGGCVRRSGSVERALAGAEGPCQRRPPRPLPAAVCACSGAVFLPSSSRLAALLASPEDRWGVEMRPEGYLWVMVFCTQRSR